MRNTVIIRSVNVTHLKKMFLTRLGLISNSTRTKAITHLLKIVI